MYKINKYNRNLTVNYALEYALKKNEDFFDYTNQGGNCTNYVSQCIYAGAPKMNVGENGWYYFSPANTSVSWANVEPLYNFLTSNNGEGPFASGGKELEMCEEGDVIQLRFNGKDAFSHALIVTKIEDKTPQGIFVCSNTRDVKNVPLAFYKYQEFRLIHILGYRTPINKF